MKLFRSIVELQNELFEVRKEGKSVGLVPTMGALHEGHASLVNRSVAENDVTVVSVFLNPTQFNDQGDLDRYPRTLDADCALLEQCGADYVFAPSVEEMYPTKDNRHFEFGEKDWQQIAVVKALVRYLGLKLQIVECDTIREADGLAKSSRNTLLAPDERAIAPKIYSALKAGKEYGATHTLKETHDKVVADINAVDGLEVEYFSIVDGNTLQEVESWDDSQYIAGCITVYCGKTPIRLIDHITFKE